jgi:hypothetical protein
MEIHQGGIVGWWYCYSRSANWRSTNLGQGQEMALTVPVVITCEILELLRELIGFCELGLIRWFIYTY